MSAEESHYRQALEDIASFVRSDEGVLPVEKYATVVYVTPEFMAAGFHWRERQGRRLVAKVRKIGYVPVAAPVIKEWPLEPHEPVPTEMESGAKRFTVTVLVVMTDA